MKNIIGLTVCLLCNLCYSNVATANAEPFLGQMTYFAGNFAPRGWAFCDGQILPISQNTALFSILGTTYGGDGRTTFGLPDMRGRVLAHAGNGPGLTPVTEGQKYGAETNVMTIANSPNHSHALVATEVEADSDAPANASIAIARLFKSTAPNVALDNGSIGSTGASAPINNIQPVVAINCIIAVQGIFPSRN